MKQLYCAYFNKMLYYTWASSPKEAIYNLRKQMLNKYGRFSINELKVKENGKWKKIQIS